jgi:hypothetical protein
MADIKVFKLNDCDWWAASDLEAAKAAYIEQTGEEDFDDAYELSDHQMEFLKFRRDDDNHTEVSFKEELERRLRDGETFPCFFASTEY